MNAFCQQPQAGCAYGYDRYLGHPPEPGFRCYHVDGKQAKLTFQEPEEPIDLTKVKDCNTRQIWNTKVSAPEQIPDKEVESRLDKQQLRRIAKYLQDIIPEFRSLAEIQISYREHVLQFLLNAFSDPPPNLSADALYLAGIEFAETEKTRWMDICKSIWQKVKQLV